MNIRYIKIAYWACTVFFALMMLSSCIADLVMIPDAIKIMTHIGFPLYLMRFMGVAKLLGLIALFVPGFPKIREWAYAGFVFNLVGAVYAHLSSGDGAGEIMRPVFFLVFLVGSYVFYRKKMKANLSS